MPRPCIPWPDKRLRTPAEDVAAITDETRALWDEMIAVMEAISERGQAVRMANPEILHASTQLREHDEASPNLPGVSARISRPRAVTVRFLNQEGEIEERDFVGLWATSVQHQIDHLAGRMYFDRLSKVKRDMLLRRARKLGAG